MFYCIKNNLTHCETMPEEDYIAIIPVEKALEINIIKKYISQIPILLTNFHFSKVEFFSDFIYGSINIPDILVRDNEGFSFIYNKSGIIFIDKNDFASRCFEEILTLYKEHINSSGIMLYYMIDYLISEDLEKMNALQQNLSQLEQDILNGINSNPIRQITDCRNSTMELYHYYVQLSGICSDLCNNTQNFFAEDSQQLFHTLSGKVSLFVRESKQIWEYTSQIRDVYQQQLDAHQNSIMKFLTIVTTIFMPLTLITGWYGMNFSYMPELRLRYSYPVLFALSIVVVIILCVIFKKKKWW